MEIDMTALIGIMWAVWLLISVTAIFEFVGCRSMVQFFPEGRRWWMFPCQLISLCNFASCVHYNPF